MHSHKTNLAATRVKMDVEADDAEGVARSGTGAEEGDEEEGRSSLLLLGGRKEKKAVAEYWEEIDWSQGHETKKQKQQSEEQRRRGLGFEKHLEREIHMKKRHHRDHLHLSNHHCSRLLLLLILHSLTVIRWTKEHFHFQSLSW